MAEKSRSSCGGCLGLFLLLAIICVVIAALSQNGGSPSTSAPAPIPTPPVANIPPPPETNEAPANAANTQVAQTPVATNAPDQSTPIPTPPPTAQDWTTTDGKTYKNVTVISHDANNITINSSDGTATFPISSLGEDVQKQINEDHVTAKDWVTLDGTTYTDVKVIKHDDQTVTILDADGGASVLLEKLPVDLQKKFGYDPSTAILHPLSIQDIAANRSLWPKTVTLVGERKGEDVSVSTTASGELKLPDSTALQLVTVGGDGELDALYNGADVKVAANKTDIFDSAEATRRPPTTKEANGFIGQTEQELISRFGKPIRVERSDSPDGPYEMVVFSEANKMATFFTLFEKDGTEDGVFYRGGTVSSGCYRGLDLPAKTPEEVAADQAKADADRPKQEVAAFKAALTRAGIDNSLIESFSVQDNDLNIVVTTQYNLLDYETRLQGAQNFEKVWTVIHGNNAFLHITDHNGNEVGGTGMMGVWVQKEQ